LISKFFIDRPIFASVLSIVITLAGGIALFVLPVAQYPQISPPTVQVDCRYPGASAQVVSETVAAPIEQQVNGVDDMLYMSSQATNDGSYNLTVTFKHGVDLNIAQVLVQNRVALAVPLLPDVIKQTGVNVKKKAPDILMAIALTSPDESRDQLYLSNYAIINVKDVLARIAGVSDVTMLGQRDYSMRVWVDPDKLASRGMTAADVAAAVRVQNTQVATGQVGQPPAPDGQPVQVPLSTLGRLDEIGQFEDIIVKARPDGRVTRLKDVARVELGAKNLDLSTRVNGKPACSMAIFQLPDANALDTADMLKAKMVEIKKDFPAGVDYQIRYDTTPFIRESIGEVFKTLREAIILVAVVVLLFLQNWRSAVIPLVAVPVAIIGTFAVMAMMGFSLNNLTLFGLVLAIGIVVDDAIVVVEATEHHIERGLSPRDATVRAMEEVSGPVIAIGLVLTAVFVPCAFISGIVGQFFRQFALTIATSTVISAFNSLTLSPALAALLLKPHVGKRSREVLPWFVYALLGGWAGYEFLGGRFAHLLAGRVPGGAPATAALAALAGAAGGLLVSRAVNWFLSVFFGLFNRGFTAATNVYTRIVGGLLRLSAIVMVAYGGLLGLTYWGFLTTPMGFIPSQDMGYVLVNVQLPDSASLERTEGVMIRMEQIALKTPGVRFTQAITGQSLLLSAIGSNFGSMFAVLEPFDRRPDPVLDRFFVWFDESVTYLDNHLEEMKRWAAPHKGDSRVMGGLRALDRRLLASHLGPKGRLTRYFKPQPPARPGAPPAPPAPGWLEVKARKALNAPKKPSKYGEAVMANLRRQFAVLIPDAMVTVLGPPPVRGVGRAGGFKLMVEDRGDNGSETLQAQTERLNEVCIQQQGKLIGMTSVFRANVPSIFVDANRRECMAKEVALKDLFDTMRIYLGSLYVNDFNKFGRTWQVIVQADQKFRNTVDDVKRLKVRNAEGGMVPLGTVADVHEVNGPLVLTRYNMYPAAPLNGAAAPGTSSGDAIQIVQQKGDETLLKNMAYEWTELAYLELQAGSTAMIVFAFAVVMVFLVLAAQYESWSLPLAIILVVPMCLLSAVLGVKVSYQDINIFTQIGFVVLVGLASKNAILIVEFAKSRREAGETRRQAALDACRLRLRPIVMTSLAFILGVVPLILGSGAGAEMRRTLGITVFSGMLGVTAFGIFLTPVFFSVVDWAGESRVFHFGPLRWVANALLNLISLSPVRRAVAASALAAAGHGGGGDAGDDHTPGNGHGGPPAPDPDPALPVPARGAAGGDPARHP